MTIVTLVSMWTPYLRVCIAEAEGREACRPIALTDPPIPLVALVVLCILWPELKSFKVAGIAEAERREVLPTDQDLRPVVPEAKGKADDFVKELEARSRKEQQRGN